MPTAPFRASLAFALVALLACSDSTRRPADGDGDGDGDADIDPCPPPLPCTGPGFDGAWSIGVAADVEEVAGERVVLLGEDGQPLVFTACGLDLAGVLRPGDRVDARNVRPEGWSDCWIGQIWLDGALVALSASCTAAGEATPPLADLGWSVALETACRGTVSRVCAASGEPVYFAIPERAFDAVVTAPSGARERVAAGRPVTVGGFAVSLVDARVTDPAEAGGCFEPAHGVFRLAAVAAPNRPACPQPPEVDRGDLGLDVSASRTERAFVVAEVQPDGLFLEAEEGERVRFGWYGPDPRRVLAAGQRVVARRYDRDVTLGGFLDVVEVDGLPVLATIASDAFILEPPSLDTLGLGLGLGEPCAYEQGVVECTGDVLVAQRFPLRLTTADGEVGEVEVGQTAAIGEWLATAVEASQYPGVWCPEYHVEAWGPFGLTLLREPRDEE